MKTETLADDALDERLVRQLLHSVDENAGVSQRQLSGELGIALGSVNWYLKRCISKGLIKMSQAPLKRYMYYLTPQGFEEKSRLTAQYLKWSLDFFRLGRGEADRLLTLCADKGLTSVYLAGDGDFAEIFILSASKSSLEIKAVFDPSSSGGQRLQVPIGQVIPPEASVILTDLSNPKAMYETLIAAHIRPDHIFVPSLLSFAPPAPPEVS
jgi:DNA-binding MarR family transcriptional regulator